MSLRVIKHTSTTAEDFARIGAMVDALLAEMIAAAAKTAPAGTVVEATAVGTVVEALGRTAALDAVSDSSLAQAVGLGLGSALMKRGTEDALDTRGAINAFIQGFAYACNKLAAEAPPTEGMTRQ